DRMAASGNFAGIGSFVVDAIQAGKLYGSVAFLGASNMLINTRQRMAVTAAYLGDSNASITPRLLMRIAKTTYRGESWFDAEPGLAMKAGVRATFSGVGNQSVLANLLYNLSARYAGIGNMATTPRLNMDSGEIDFTGVGSMAAVTRQRMAVTGTFGGESDFDITPRLRMRAFANYSGAGSMFVDLTPPIMAWTGQAAFTGEGALSAVGTFDLTAAASMEAAGNLSVDTIRLINLSEQFFAGTGSFIVGDVQQILAGFVNYGGTGYFSIHTTISSARLEWLVCASIGFKPELDVALTISPELPASLAVNSAIEGKPEMKVC
ncbi:MAG TPA: hypothetical protein VFK30_01245, partial [Anaerolineae bacterium]|nr:hypothetical protein [Anaerolineae bacterium]